MTNSRRADFPLLVNNPGLHYLDSAATSQKPRVVLDAMRDYYERDNANPHRGAYDLSARATERYHAARARIARFIGVADSDCLIFTRGTTESLNLVATAWGYENVSAGDEIVVTALEHHANFVPWQQLALARGAKFLICPLTEDQRVDLVALQSLMSARTKVVAFNHVSNAVGTLNPVRDIVRIARTTSALVVCDGAQGAPHLRVGFDDLDVDFYAFSGHKMCGPMGVGGLVGKRALLEAMRPYQFGGDMIDVVRDDATTWNVLPHKFEAGTPNVADAIGLAAACEYLDGIGMDNVLSHERELVQLASERLAEIDGIRVYGPPAAERSGVVSFTVADIHPHDLATIFDGEGVCIRAGHHCAQPLMRRLGVSATARASFYVYSDESDVEAMVRALERARVVFAG
ncbi:MAG: SufS family cysteine desulfurase [Gemmatimonadota bacterium]|nr:SufS family cysteine desulfurase [Gemmatimonadota bacterium]